MDIKFVNGAVKVKLELLKILKRQTKLQADLIRMLGEMNNEELNEYRKRVN